MLSRAVELGQARFGLTDKHTMIAAANLGSVWIQTGKIDQAKKLHLDVLENCKKTLGENHITTMYAGSRAAQTLLKADEPERALETIQPVFEQFYALRGETHHDTITVRRVLARIYRALNQSEAARDQLEHAVKAAESDPKQFSQLAQQIRSELQQLNK